MGTKILAWLKAHHLGWLAVVLATVACFMLGRRSNGGTSADFDKLRTDYTKLTDQLREREAELNQLRKLHSDDAKQYRIVAIELAEARAALESIGESVESGQGDIGELKTTNQRLTNWIQKYGSQFASSEKKN